MPFQSVEPPTNNLLYPDPDSILVRLRYKLPGHDEAYYLDMQERIVSVAMARGQNIASVVESFIVGAELRGEGPSGTERAVRNTATCQACRGTGNYWRRLPDGEQELEPCAKCGGKGMV